MQTLKQSMEGGAAPGGSLMAVLAALCGAHRGGEGLPTVEMADDLLAAVTELLCAVEDGQLVPDMRNGETLWYRTERAERLRKAVAALRGLAEAGVR